MNTPEPTNIKSRRGRFSIQESLLGLNPEAVIQATSRCLIFRAEMRYEDMSMHYWACSDLFEDCGDNMKPPRYSPRFEKQEDESITFLGFERINES